MHSSTCMTPLVGGGPRHTPSCRKLRMRVRMTSNMERPQQRRSLVRRSPSRAMAICCARERNERSQMNKFNFHATFKIGNFSSSQLTCGVPNLSIRGTRCRGAYLASSLFILTSSRSPSAFNTQGQDGSYRTRTNSGRFPLRCTCDTVPLM